MYSVLDILVSELKINKNRLQQDPNDGVCSNPTVPLADLEGIRFAAQERKAAPLQCFPAAILWLSFCLYQSVSDAVYVMLLQSAVTTATVVLLFVFSFVRLSVRPCPSVCP